MADAVTQDKQVDVRELLGVARRHLVLIFATAALLSGIGAAVIFNLPDVYVSRSVVYVEAAKLPSSFLQAGTAVPELKQIIGTLRQRLLSRDTLRSVVNDLQLYEEQAPDPADPNAAPAPEGFWRRLFYKDPIERAREDIDVRIVARHGAEYVEISARARTGELAKRAVQRMSDLLAAYDHEMRENDALEEQAFLEVQLAKSERVLEEDDRVLRVFRDEHRESLPEKAEEIKDYLARLASRVESRGREAAEIERRYREASERLGRVLEGAIRPEVVDPRLAELDERIRRLDERLAILRATRTETHPEVEATRRQRDKLAADRAELLAPGSAPGSETPGSSLPEDAPPGSAPPGSAPPGSAPPASSASGAAPADRAAAAPPATPPGEAAGAGSPPAGSGAPDAAPPPKPLDPLEVRRALDAREADPATRAEAERLLAEIAAAVRALEEIEVADGRDRVALDRAEQLQAALPRTQAAEQKLVEARTISDSVVRQQRADWELLQKFLVLHRARRGSQLRTIEAAEAPPFPDEPKRLRLMAMAVVAALGVGFGLAYLSDIVRDSFRGPADVERALGLRVLAIVPTLEDDHRAPGSPRSRARSGRPLAQVATEQLNRLRYAVLHPPGGAARAPRTVLVTSALAGEGKSTVALGLARAFARSLDHWSMLVETDLRNPSLAYRTGLDGAIGLSEHLERGVPLHGIIQRAGLEKLSVILAGRRTGDAASLVGSAAMQRLAAEMAERYADRVVIFDAPPLLATPEPLSLAQFVDAVVLVVRAGATSRKVVDQALKSLPAGKVLGVVLNGVDLSSDQIGGQAYYYQAPESEEGLSTSQLRRQGSGTAILPAFPAEGPAAGESILGPPMPAPTPRQPASAPPAPPAPPAPIAPIAATVPARPAAAPTLVADGPLAAGVAAPALALQPAVVEPAAPRRGGPDEAARTLANAPARAPASTDAPPVAPGPGAAPQEGREAPAVAAGAAGEAAAEAVSDLAGASSPAAADGEVDGVEAAPEGAAASFPAAGVEAAAPDVPEAEAAAAASPPPDLGGLDWLFESGRLRAQAGPREPGPDASASDAAGPGAGGPADAHRPDLLTALDPLFAAQHASAGRAARVPGSGLPAQPPPRGSIPAPPPRPASGVFPGQRARLVVLSGAERGKAVELVGTSYAIGRSPSVDLTLADEGISRRNCRLFWVQEALWIVDLRSTNGTFVNEERVLKQRLAIGDTIRLGSTVLRIEPPSDDPWQDGPPTADASVATEHLR